MHTEAAGYHLSRALQHADTPLPNALPLPNSAAYWVPLAERWALSVWSGECMAAAEEAAAPSSPPSSAPADCRCEVQREGVPRLLILILILMLPLLYNMCAPRNAGMGGGAACRCEVEGVLHLLQLLLLRLHMLL